MDQVTAAKAARDALIKADADEKVRLQDAKLLKMKNEQEEIVSKQRKDDAKAIQKQP